MNIMIMPQLKELIQKLEDFLDKKKQREFDALRASFKILMDTLLLEYGKGENHSNPQQFIENDRGRRLSSDQFPTVLQGIIYENTDVVFLKNYPFIREILDINSVIVNLLNSRSFEKLNNILLVLKKLIHNQEILIPLAEMERLAVSAATLSDTQDQANELGIITQRGKDPLQMLSQLEGVIRSTITYAQREQCPYNQLDWHVIQVLCNMASLSDYKHLFSNLKQIQPDLITLAEFLHKLIEYEKSRVDDTLETPEITKIHLPKIMIITQFFEDIENIQCMIHYLEPLNQIKEDNLTTRLAILRALCALGEAAKNISSRFKIDNKFFRKLEIIRNGIIHPDGKEVKKNLKLFLRDENNKTLYSLLNDFSKILPYLKNLLEWRRQHYELEESNLVVPQLRSDCLLISGIELELRKFKLTKEQREKLKLTLPKEDKRFINQQRQSLSDILYGRTLLPANYADFIKLAEGLGLSNKAIKDFHVKLKQKQILNSIMTSIKNKNFENINKRLDSLQLSKEKKQKLKEILDTINGDYQLLLPFLQEYELDVTPKEKEISALLRNLPIDEIDLQPSKTRLLNAINQEEEMIDRITLLKDIDILFFNDAENSKLWQEAINALSSSNANQSANQNDYKAQTIYDYIIKQINEIINAIELINEILQTNKFKFTPDWKYSQFTENHLFVFACEHAFTMFYNHAKSLLNKIEEIKNYKDISSYSIFIPDFIVQIQSKLTQYLLRRNNIAHLNGLYFEPDKSPFINSMILADSLEDITIGTYFSDGINITSQKVTHEPIRSTSLLNILNQCEVLVNTTKSKQINKLLDKIGVNRENYNETLQKQKVILKKLSINLTDHQILAQFKNLSNQDKNYDDKNELLVLTHQLDIFREEFDTLQNRLLCYLGPIKTKLDDKPIEFSNKPSYVLQSNPDVFLQEISVPGDGWCALYAAGFGRDGLPAPEQVIESLKLNIDNPEIMGLLIKPLENNFQASISLNSLLDLDTCDNDGELILNKINYYYQQIQQADDASQQEANAYYISYMSRPDVLKAYINYLLKTKYADAIIVQACLSLFGKKLALFINYGLADGRLVNYSGDSTDINDPNTVSIIYYPSINPLLAHYNRLNVMVNHTFTFQDANAGSVHLAGSFNQWLDASNASINPKNADYLMKKRELDKWEITVPLTTELHEFKYVINGNHWQPKYQNSSMDMRRSLNSLNIPSSSNLVFVRVGSRIQAQIPTSNVETQKDNLSSDKGERDKLKEQIKNSVKVITNNGSPVFQKKKPDDDKEADDSKNGLQELTGQNKEEDKRYPKVNK